MQDAFRYRQPVSQLRGCDSFVGCYMLNCFFFRSVTFGVYIFDLLGHECIRKPVERGLDIIFRNLSLEKLLGFNFKNPACELELICSLFRTFLQRSITFVNHDKNF